MKNFKNNYDIFQSRLGNRVLTKIELQNWLKEIKTKDFLNI
jgi:hypothetical protein